MNLDTFSQRVSRLDKAVASLPPNLIALFSAACAERFFPFYVYFESKENWGDSRRFRLLLDEVWLFLLSPDAPRAPVDIEEVMSAAPHSDDFGDISTLLAQAFCI